MATLPGPRSLPLVGHSLELRKDPTGFLVRTRQECGDMARISVGWIPVVLAFHPDQVRQILVENHKSFTAKVALDLSAAFNFMNL